MKVYLVGGAVRDMLLGLEPKDCDYVVVGSSPEEMLSLGYTQVGADFPVFLHPTTGEEYALARIERKTKAGYNGFEVDFDSTVTLEEDLYRRDLTINSMAIDQLTGDLIDPYGGLDDLKNEILRHTSEAFAEDPVRVLRVARFAARYNEFSICASTLSLMAEVVRSGEFDSLTPERIWAEFKKGLMEDTPSRMFLILERIRTNQLKEFFSNSPDAYEALDRAAKEKESLEVRFAIISTGFKYQESFQRWRVSADCGELAFLVHNNKKTIAKYHELSPIQRVQLFNRIDLWRRKYRVGQMYKACYYVNRRFNAENIEEYYSKTNFEFWDDINELEKVNAGAIAMSAENKTKIKDLIFDARVNAITKEAVLAE